MCEIKTYIHLLIDIVLTESWQSLNKEILISDECKQNLKEKIFLIFLLTHTLTSNRSL